MGRPLLFVSQAQEMAMIQKLAYEIDRTNIHPDDTCLLMVSPDYSAIAAQILAHELSKDKHMLDLEAVHVPYPDQAPDEFIERFKEEFVKYKDDYKNFLLVEAGIIRGGNWTWLVNTMIEMGIKKENIITAAVYENIHSKYRSDYVGEYYNNDLQDLTYWWEKPNAHWDGF